MNEYNNQYIACTVNGTTKDCSQHGLKYGDVISGFKAQCVGNQSNNKIPAVMVFEVINWQNQKVFPPTQYEGTVFHSDSNGFYHLENIHYTIQNSGPITVKTTCYHECHIMHEDNSNLRPKKNITFEVPYGTIMGFVFDMFGNKIYTEDGLPDFHYPLKDPEGDEPDHYGLGRIQSGDQAVIITGYECVGGECIMVNASLYHGGTQE